MAFSEYRGNPCPARAGGLPHTQSGLTCIHCGRPVSAYPASVPEATPPAMDVTARLEALGLLTPVTDTEVVSGEVPHEARFITGNGPQGKPTGVGRGEFTARDKWRTLTHVEYRASLAARGGGEEA